MRKVLLRFVSSQSSSTMAMNNLQALSLLPWPNQGYEGDSVRFVCCSPSDGWLKYSLCPSLTLALSAMDILAVW